MTSSIKGACVGFLNKGWEFVSSVPSSVKGLSVYSTFVGVTSAIASNLLYQRSCATPEPKCTTTPASGHLWWHVPEKTECDTPQEACIESSVPYSLIVPAVSLVPFAVRLAAYSIGKMRSCCGVDQRLARIAFEADYAVRSLCRNAVIRGNSNLKGPDLKNRMFEYYLQEIFGKNQVMEPWKRLFHNHPEMKDLNRKDALKKLEKYYSDGEKTKRMEMANRIHEAYFQSKEGEKSRRDCVARALAFDWSLEGEALKKKALEIYLQENFSNSSQDLETYYLNAKNQALSFLPGLSLNVSIESLGEVFSDFCEHNDIKLSSPNLDLYEEIILDPQQGIIIQDGQKKKAIADRLLKAYFIADQNRSGRKTNSVIRGESETDGFMVQAMNRYKALLNKNLVIQVANEYIHDRFSKNNQEVDKYLSEAKISVFKLNPELAGVCKGDLNQLLEKFCEVHKIDVPSSSLGGSDDQKEE